jgi:serine/threonine protein kinase
MPREMKTGDRISEYVLEERIGQGTFGEVWRARHHVFNERVAIKVPTDSEFIRNLQSEGVIQHEVVSEHIVRSKGLDPWHDPPYLVMEYVAGPSLRGLLREKRALDVPTAVDYARQILEALSAAHAKGVVHRDLKPENVLIGPGGVVKVADFGLGRALATTTASIMMSGSLESVSGKSISGTLEYMSPEQRAGQDADARTDLYALGVMLFEMLTGERPSGSEMPSELAPAAPAALDEVYRRCYARLEKRYATAGEALAALAAAMRPPEEHPTARLLSTAPEPPLVLGPITCASCKGDVQDGDFFCPHCGAQLRADLKRCPRCGGFPQEHDQFCIFCGQTLAVRSP